MGYLCYRGMCYFWRDRSANIVSIAITGLVLAVLGHVGINSLSAVVFKSYALLTSLSLRVGYRLPPPPHTDTYLPQDGCRCGRGFKSKCAVCMQTVVDYVALTANTDLKDLKRKDLVSYLPCNHMMALHSQCVDVWNAAKCPCPVCGKNSKPPEWEHMPVDGCQCGCGFTSMCPICQEEVVDYVALKNDNQNDASLDKVGSLACRHLVALHGRCVASWLAMGALCPVCGKPQVQRPQTDRDREL